MSNNKSAWVRTCLLLCCIALAVVWINQQISLKRLTERNAKLRTGLPANGIIDQHSIRMVESVVPGCQRYYLSVAAGKSVQGRINTGNRQIDLGPIEAGPEGRLFQFWCALTIYPMESYLTIYTEEISPDGRNFLRRPEPHFAQSRETTLSFPTSPIHLDSQPNLTTNQQRIALSRDSDGKLLVEFALIPIDERGL